MKQITLDDGWMGSETPIIYYGCSQQSRQRLTAMIQSQAFQSIRVRLGYKTDDILPLSREVFELEHWQVIKHMSVIEKQFYINRKMELQQNKRKLIIAEIEQELKKDHHQGNGLSFNQMMFPKAGNYMPKKHNPAIHNLFIQHDKMLEKKQRQKRNLLNKQIKDQQEKQRLQSIHLKNNQHLRNTISNTSHQSRSNRQNIKTSSGRSSRSEQSARSNSSQRSTESAKEKLRMVREKQKDRAMYQKQWFLQRQKESSRKSMRAEENALNRSRQLKTRSQISRTIVYQNKRELQFIEHEEVRDHLQRLKFKMQKTEMIRQKNSQKKHDEKTSNSDWRNSNRIKLKKLMEDNDKLQNKYRYDEKRKKAENRIDNNQVIRSEAISYQNQTLNLKLHNSKEAREYTKKEKEKYLILAQQHQEQRFQNAHLNRKNHILSVQDKSMEEKWRSQLVRQQKESLDWEQKKNAELIIKKEREKLEELEDINRVKKKLLKERKSADYNLKEAKRYSVGVDPNKTNRSKFNSLLHLLQ